MPKLLKEALSTRKALQKKPNIDLIKELSDEDVKALQGVFLEMLKDLDRVCAEHHITYMAAGGTALGAVRHEGFIPWDDDVDILMPRKDLDRFVEIFDGAMGEKYGLTSPNTKYMLESNISAIYKKHTRKVSFEAYNTPYPKGIHVDIFAIETVPMNPLVRRIKGTVAMGLQFIAVSTRYPLVYGSLASIILLMFWLFLCCQIIYTGEALNEAIFRERQMRENKEPGEKQPAKE